MSHRTTAPHVPTTFIYPPGVALCWRPQVNVTRLAPDDGIFIAQNFCVSQDVATRTLNFGNMADLRGQSTVFAGPNRIAQPIRQHTLR